MTRRARPAGPSLLATPDARPLRYHLRFQILPGPAARQHAADLARFCLRHGVEEAVLFFAAEEWNNGLLSRQEEDAWFRTVEQSKRVLERAGISVSLNPWMTILHCDRGRRFPPDRHVTPIESPLGEKSRACASFADPRWQSYFFRLLARFARLGFRVIWLEDDFRYHNHAPLAWGGGFERPVLDRFAAKIGRRVTREQVVRAILRPGQPHAWRALWMETWRELQIEVARGAAEAVATDLPGPSRLGLMSSHPTSHSTEGRDWRALFDTLSIEGRVAHRPHFAPYSETPGRQATYPIIMLDVQREFRPPRCEVAPEIENFPFTRWSKSDAQTWSEMAWCQFYGSDALLLDLFPFIGNPASEEPQIAELLDRSRPALEWIAARFPATLATQGVGAPWRQDANAHVRTAQGRSLWELDATPLGPGSFLLPYGVPVSARCQAVNALFGSLAWAFDDDALREMLSGGLLLDAVAADILNRRGFGRDVGVAIERWVDRQEDTYAVEQVLASDSGARPGLCFNANLMDRVARLHSARGTRTWTQLLRADGSRFGAFLVTHRNRRGGRVATYAATDPAALPRTYQRQAITHGLIDFLGAGRFRAARVRSAPYALPVHFRHGRRDCVVVMNGNTDPAAPIVHVPGVKGRPLATRLAPLAPPASADVRVVRQQGGVAVHCLSPLPYFGFLVLDWR